MKNPDIFICEVIETKMNENINKINKNDSIFKADTLHNELRILDCILHQVCNNNQNNSFSCSYYKY